jgi:hypothetical protein
MKKDKEMEDDFQRMNSRDKMDQEEANEDQWADVLSNQEEDMIDDDNSRDISPDDALNGDENR